MAKIRDCKQCGNSFTPKHPRTLYCCRECVGDAERVQRAESKRARRKEPEIFVCAHCDVEWPRKCGTQRFCSDRCRRSGENIVRRRTERSKVGVSQKNNDIRQLRGLLGKIKKDSEQYRVLREVHPSLPLDVYDVACQRLDDAIAELSGLPGKGSFFAKTA